MKADYTDITLILDRSGSMAVIQKDAAGGIKHFIDEQKKVDGDVRLSLVQFDDKYESVFEALPVKNAPIVVVSPRGGTALLDAIGRTIIAKGGTFAAMPEHERPAKVIVVIVTDGEENSSKEFTSEKVNDLISEQREKYKWEFVFIGANQDALKTAERISIPVANAMTMDYSGLGTKEAFGSVARNVGAYASGVSLSASFSAEDRQKQSDLLKGKGA